MKVYLTCILFIWSTGLYAQKGKLIFGSTFVPSIFPKTSTTYFGHKFESTVEYSSGWNVQGAIGYFRRRSKTFYGGSYYQSSGMISTISITRRLIDYRCFVTPIGGITLGTSLFNSRSVASFTETSWLKSENIPEDYYQKMRFFLSAKIQFQLSYKNVVFRVGPTYSFYETRIISDKQKTSRIINGYGYDLGVYYTLDGSTKNAREFITSKIKLARSKKTSL